MCLNIAIKYLILCDMVELRRVELLTSCLQGRRSSQLSYSPIFKIIMYFKSTLKNKQLNLSSFKPFSFSLERRWSSRTFRYGYLVTTSPQSLILPSTVASLRLAHRLRLFPTLMVWRAVCTRPGNVFTVACWSTITSNSDFVQASCSLQSELGRCFWVLLHLAVLLLFVKRHCSTCVAQVIKGMMIWRHPHLPPFCQRQSGQSPLA